MVILVGFLCPSWPCPQVLLAVLSQRGCDAAGLWWPGHQTCTELSFHSSDILK